MVHVQIEVVSQRTVSLAKLSSRGIWSRISMGHSPPVAPTAALISSRNTSAYPGSAMA